jgi:(E)-4-hydroxy-3-methylbut-2-enyl-diphosphate synthase
MLGFKLATFLPLHPLTITMQTLHIPSYTHYQRITTKEVKIGDLLIGNHHPIRIQTMTTTDTMDTEATVAQTIRCIEAGAELVRITAPSKKEAENLQLIKDSLRAQGFTTPLVADIHFTPNAAEMAARIVEKVRINPGNYIDKKKFDFIDYTDAEYHAEIDRIRQRFTPLIKICKEYGTAMRIGTNHGSLSDRIMSRYGDTPIGMVESAMEFLRIARDENYHQIVLSMKSSNPLVMVQAYRLLVQKMDEEFGEIYPLHLGVTEAGDGEDGRIKSAIGIGSLLADGIGDTIRVSLTEDPEFEIPVCKDIVKQYNHRTAEKAITTANNLTHFFNPYAYQRRTSLEVGNIGKKHVPVVVADLSNEKTITPQTLESIGYHYNAVLDKWKIGDGAADYIFIGNKTLNFELPGTLQIICNHDTWISTTNKTKYHPLLSAAAFLKDDVQAEKIFIKTAITEDAAILSELLKKIKDKTEIILCVSSQEYYPLLSIRRFLLQLESAEIACPVLLCVKTDNPTIDDQLIHLATHAGGLLLDGWGDGLWLTNNTSQLQNLKITGRTYLAVNNNNQFLNNTAFSILQATRTRISKTEYISCPSCGRTLFDLQETTAKIRAATHHLKGVKIAVMGCIVNGPGEMADADFGYVGSGPGKITLYKGKEVVKKNINSDVAVDELIQLLKENEVWIEKEN